MSRWVRRILLLAGLGMVVWAVLRKLDADEPEPGTGPAAWPPLQMAEARDTPEGDETAGDETAPWVEPDVGGCPESHPVKGNVPSGIYHVPGGRFYERTKAERCYCDPAAAEADGLRASKA